MSIYKELGLKTVINASDTYTRIGGSRMNQKTLDAMCDAAKSFVDITELSKAVSREIAKLTNNEAAFVSSGASACVVLTSAYLMTGNSQELIKMLPDTSKCEKNEIIVFDSQTKIPMLPYWHLIELSGAKLVRVGPDLESLKQAIGPKTAGMFFFLADIYEAGLPPIAEVIKVMNEHGVKIIIDAAAQLPPKSNLWYYTKDLGADGIIFSGGKFLMGPQSTGLFLGSKEIADGCYALTCPNLSVGRPYKVGKEEFAAIYTAVKQFVEIDAEDVKKVQNAHLDEIENVLVSCKNISVKRVHQGRLAQDEPMLVIDLPSGKDGAACAKYLYDNFDPAIDIGFFLPGDDSGTGQQVFINSINLRDGEPQFIAESLKLYLAL